MNEETLERMGILLLRRAELDAEFRAAQPEYTKHRVRCNGLIFKRDPGTICPTHTGLWRKINGIVDEAIENAQAIAELRDAVLTA